MEAHHSLIALGLAIERFPREGVAEEVETGTFPIRSGAWIRIFHPSLPFGPAADFPDFEARPRGPREMR